MGTIKFRGKRVIWRKDKRVKFPVLEALDVKRRRHPRDVRMKLAEFASKISYKDASLEFETATGIHIPATHQYDTFSALRAIVFSQFSDIA